MAVALVGIVAVAAVVIGLPARDALERARRADARVTALSARVHKLDRALIEARDEGAARAADNEQLAGKLSELGKSVNDRVDFAALAQKVKPSVFAVVSEGGTGTAWVVGGDGRSSTLITNFHVVADVWAAGHNPSVKLKQGDLTYPAKVLAVDEGDDLALLSTDIVLPELGRASERPAVGASVLAVGSPLGLEGSVSSGIVSSIRKQDGQEFIQFTAPISPGNSGGPVVDGQGRVVGVATLKAVMLGAEGLGFAVPVDQVCDQLVLC